MPKNRDVWRKLRQWAVAYPIGYAFLIAVDVKRLSMAMSLVIIASWRRLPARMTTVSLAGTAPSLVRLALLGSPGGRQASAGRSEPPIYGPELTLARSPRIRYGL